MTVSWQDTGIKLYQLENPTCHNPRKLRLEQIWEVLPLPTVPSQPEEIKFADILQHFSWVGVHWRGKSHPGRLPLHVSRVESAALGLLRERGNVRLWWSILRSRSVGKCVWLPWWKWEPGAPLQLPRARGKTDPETGPICLEVKVRRAKPLNIPQPWTWSWQKRLIWVGEIL